MAQMKMSIEVLEDKTGEISQKAEKKKRIQKLEKKRKKSENQRTSSQVQHSNIRTPQETQKRK